MSETEAVPHAWLSVCVVCGQYIAESEHRTLRVEAVAVDLIREGRTVVGPFCDGCVTEGL